MLDNYIDDLQDSIDWAHERDDIEILHLARYRMDQLLSAINTLPVIKRASFQAEVDKVLPMEWPLWMEACRYNDGDETTEKQFYIQ